MKYKPTPFNIATLGFLGIVLWYFTKAHNNDYFDRHGWIAVFTAIPAMIIAPILFFVDLGIQLSKKPRTYNKVLIIEGLIIAIILLFLGGMGFFHSF